MRIFTPLRATVSIAALIWAGAAQADLSAQAVWDDWKEQFTIFGDTTLTTGPETMTGDTLVVSGVTSTTVDDISTTVVEFGDLAFTELGDGRVRISTVDSYPLTYTDADITVSAAIINNGLELVANADPDAIDYVFTAAELGFEIIELIENSEDIPIQMSISLSDLAGTGTTRLGEMRDESYQLQAGSGELLLDVRGIEQEDGTVVLGGKTGAVTLAFETSIPRNATTDSEAMADMRFGGSYTLENSELVFDITDDGNTVAGSLTSNGSEVSGAFAPDGMTYSADTTGIELNVTADALGVPLRVAMERYGVGLTLPADPEAGSSPFALRLDLVGLELDDFLWSMLDSNNTLPRGPASFEMAVSGMLTPLYNFLADEPLPDTVDPMRPIAPDSLSIDTFRIDALDAEITATGAFTFDNSDTTTFNGAPRPEGTATVNATGLNALLDNLVAAGLLPQDQVMGARMMIGMFARSTGADQVTSTIEIDETGAVSVNGSRVR